MQVWQIILPKRDNAGTRVYMAHKKFELELLECYGGFTVAECGGAWKDDDGKVYRDESLVYTIAVDYPAADSEPALASLAAPLFPDQLAFYVAHLGTAEIVPRSLAI